MAVMTSKSDIIHSAQIQLIADKGELAANAELSKCSLSWTGNITLPPSGTYSYVLAGKDRATIPFVHHTQKTVDYESGQDYYQLKYTGKEDVVVEVGERAELNFELESQNPYGPTTFRLKAERLVGFSYTAEPSEVTLSPGETTKVKAVYLPASSILEPGLSHTATLTATNGCATLSTSKDITIMVQNRPSLAIQLRHSIP